ncbi:hypothetical protein OAF41_00180 [bacterium]|nr:hypothetical protein [bacterium]
MKMLVSILPKPRIFLPLVTLATLAFAGVSTADQKSAIEVAKAHIQSNLTGEYKKLAETYAPRVMLMPGHEYLKERYGLAEAGARGKGAEVDRDKFIASMEKASGGRPALPKEHADRILGTLGYESVEVEEGDFATAASAPVGTPDGKLHFMIKKDDLLIKVAPPKGDFILLHLRREGDSWKVVSEYLD